MSEVLENVNRAERTAPPGVFFVIEYPNGADFSTLDPGNLEIRSFAEYGRIIREVVGQHPEIFTRAIELSENNRSSQFRFSMDTMEKTLNFELHCFPRPDSPNRSIGCFLIDRSLDEADRARIGSRIHELDLISQAVRAFAETRNLSEILRIILLAVTAGKGLGFNRGFILLSDDARECLWGCMATGPSSPEEAGRIWSDLQKSQMTLDEILRLYKIGDVGDTQVNKLVTSVKIPMSGDTDFVARAALERRPVIIGPEMIWNDTDRALRDKFGVEYMAVVPLVARDSLQGVILADNIITLRPISQSDLRFLEIFARYASDAIENSRLYGKLERQVELLKEANEMIIRSRENLVRAEKLSSIGRMALDVAHEVRNPLTIIGGYANLRLRRINGDDGSANVLQLISSQVNRIERTLDRFSSVVKLSEKNEDHYLLAELIRETLGMLSSEATLLLPRQDFPENLSEARVFIDKGLFHQALMAILREAAKIARGMENISLEVVGNDGMAVIFIDGGEKNPKFAEEFYGGLRKGKEEHRYQDMAVALEILRHYGGDIGIGSSQGIHGRLFIEIPMGEEKR